MSRLMCVTTVSFQFSALPDSRDFFGEGFPLKLIFSHNFYLLNSPASSFVYSVYPLL